MTDEQRNQKMVDDLIKVQEEVMGKQEDKEAGEVKETANDVKETVEASEKEQDSMMNVGQDGQDKGEKKEYKEITLKFGKGYVGEEFEAKDGKKYRQVSIPNEDKSDKSSWRTFVVRANQVHDNKYGKGMFCKLPADGSTTVMQSVKIGIDENGKDMWENTKTKVPNKELKKMVESYKGKNKESALQNKISKKQTEVEKNKSAEKQTPNKAHDQAR